jgi:hypothetical protein
MRMETPGQEALVEAAKREAVLAEAAKLDAFAAEGQAADVLSRINDQGRKVRPGRKVREAFRCLCGPA